MDRADKRLRAAEAKKKLKLPEGEFREIDLAIKPHPDWMTRSFMNNRYIVMIDDNAETTKGSAIRIMVQTLDDKPIINHWSEMQRIKNTLFGHDKMAIEYYPRDSELVDTCNIYWMWIFPPNIIPIPIN